MATTHFYHSAGLMLGADTHPYASTDNKPQDTPYAVGAILWFGDDLVKDVTADGHKMVHQHSKITGRILIHKAITKKPPGSAQKAIFKKIVKEAKSSAEHATPTVFAHGKPLADCFIFMIGVNENCGSTPYNNLVLNYCTVVTKATIDDQVRKAIKSWVQQLVKYLEDLLKKKLSDAIWAAITKDPRLRWLKLFEPILKPMLDTVVGWVIDALDWLLDPADKIYKGIMRALGDDDGTTPIGKGGVQPAAMGAGGG